MRVKWLAECSAEALGGEWVDDLAARFGVLGIDPEAPPTATPPAENAWGQVTTRMVQKSDDRPRVVR